MYFIYLIKMTEVSQQNYLENKDNKNLQNKDQEFLNLLKNLYPGQKEEDYSNLIKQKEEFFIKNKELDKEGKLEKHINTIINSREFSLRDLNQFLMKSFEDIINEKNFDYDINSDEIWLFSNKLKKLIKSRDIDKKSEDINNNEENIKKARDILDQHYKTIPEIFKTSNNAEKRREFILSDDVKKIRQSVKFQALDQDKQEKYLGYRFAAVQLANANEPVYKKYEFIQSFNQLNKFLEIDVQISFDARTDDRKEKNISKPDSLGGLKTNGEAVLKNKDISYFVDDVSEEDQEITDVESIRNKLDWDNNIENPKKILELYFSKDGEPSWRLKYLNADLSIDKNTLKNDVRDEKEEKRIIDDIEKKKTEALEDSLIDIQGRTNKLFKERIMTNCFQALASYFDNTTPNMENFADDFKMDINQDISFDRERKEINMQWTINWNHVWLHYNMNTWELEMDDFMSYKNEKNGWTYVMWIKNGQREKLKVKLPTFQALKDSVGEIWIIDYIKDATTMSDYEKNMKSDLDTSISKNFADMNLNKYYVEQFNEKNIAEQSVLSDIFHNWEVVNGTPIIKFDEETEISSTLKPKQYELIKLIFDSLESYKDPDKLREFRNCIARLNLIINTNEVKEWRSNEVMFNELFNNEEINDKNKQSVKKSMENRKNNQWEINYFQLFDLMSKWFGDEKIINLEVFDRVLNITEKKEEINDNPHLAWYNWFMDKYREKYYNL